MKMAYKYTTHALKEARDNLLNYYAWKNHQQNIVPESQCIVWCGHIKWIQVISTMESKPLFEKKKKEKEKKNCYS